MIWILRREVLGEYSIDLDVLDGDIKKVVPEDMSIDIGVKPIRRSLFFQCGRRVKTDFLPTQARRSGSKDSMPDLLEPYLAQVCSEDFKAIIERLDPEKHQFEPLDIIDSKGNSEERNFYWFIPCTRLFGLHPEKTKPGFGPSGHFLQATDTDEWELVFRQNVIAGHHVFCIAEFPGLIFVTDDVKQACEDAEMIGAVFNGPYSIDSELE